MKIVNLTPHPITLQTPSGERVTLPTSGTVARVSSVPGEVYTVAGIPVPVQSSPIYGLVEGLPKPEEGVCYIVSGMVLARCQHRSDVFAPATGPQDGAIRDEKGQIVAVTKLVASI